MKAAFTAAGQQGLLPLEPRGGRRAAARALHEQYAAESNDAAAMEESESFAAV